MTLLVVEDETLIAMDLEDMLEDLGHKVIDVAGSLDSALAMVDKYVGDIDGVILDANLGGASALPVAIRLREGNIPFVITSGYEKHELLGKGFDAPWISKPYKSDEIDRALRTASAA